MIQINNKIHNFVFVFIISFFFQYSFVNNSKAEKSINIDTKTKNAKNDDLKLNHKREKYIKRVEKENKRKKEEEKYKNNEYFLIGTNAGSDGFGFSVGYTYKYIGLKFQASTLKIKSINIGNQNYITPVIEDYGFNFTIYPIRWFYLSIGCHYIKYDINILAKRELIIGSSIIDDDVHISIGAGKGFTPYFGFGFDIRLFYQFYLNIELGIMATGKWNINSFDMDVSGKELLETNIKFNNTYEETRYVTGYNFPRLSFWPIIKLGFAYRFYV